eukprot:COSAG05_NODE_9892_length_595_cov_1.038306_1_plen_151_part_00
MALMAALAATTDTLAIYLALPTGGHIGTAPPEAGAQRVKQIRRCCGIIQQMWISILCRQHNAFHLKWPFGTLRDRMYHFRVALPAERYAAALVFASLTHSVFGRNVTTISAIDWDLPGAEPALLTVCHDVQHHVVQTIIGPLQDVTAPAI